MKMIEILENKLSKTFWYFLLLVGMASWASLFPFLKMLGSEISSTNIALARYLIAFIVLYPFCHYLKMHFVVKKKHILPISLLGLLATAITTIFIAWGIQYSTVIHSSLLVNSNPLFIGLLAPLFIHEKTNWKKIVGVVVGLIGINLIILNGQPVIKLLEQDFLLGIGLLLGASFCQVIYTIFIKRYLRYYTGITITLYAMLAGAIFMIATTLVTGDIWDVTSFSGKEYILLGLIGVVSTAIPLVIFSASIKKLGAINSSSFKFTIPIFATIFAILFFKEKLSLWIFFGIVLTSIGIYTILHVKAKRKIRKLKEST